MNMELASDKDEPWIRQLLNLCGLPDEDITPEHLKHFWVLKDGFQIAGVVGIEILGSIGLLRSLAVQEKFRKGGLGSQLVQKAENHAVSLKLKALYLLTLTADDFFAKRGYRKIARATVPPEVQKTPEFQGICPASSVCMVKFLKG
jgi:amino-acid N-acetyltransferase